MQFPEALTEICNLESEINKLKDQLCNCKDLNMIDLFKFVDVNSDNMVTLNELQNFIE